MIFNNTTQVTPLKLSLSTSGTIGVNTTTTNKFSAFAITATAENLSFFIPLPSLDKQGYEATIYNNGTRAFSINGVKINNGESQVFRLLDNLFYSESTPTFEVVNVTGATLPITFPIATIPGTPVFLPNTPADPLKLYTITDGATTVTARFNGTNYISAPAPATVSAANISLVNGSLTATSQIKLTDGASTSSINVDDLFSLPPAKNSQGKVVMGKSLLVLSAVQPTPTATGNTTNLNTTFKDANGDTWIVDGTGIAIKSSSAIKKSIVIRQSVIVGANVITHNFGSTGLFEVEVKVRSISGTTLSDVTLPITSQTANSVTINATVAIANARIAINEL